MKKLKRLFLLTIALYISTATAQTPDAVIARAYYTYRHQIDANKKENIYKEDMLLALGKNASVFTGLSRIYQSRNLVQQAEEQTKAYTGNDFPVIQYKVDRYTTPTDVYRFAGEHKMYVKENLIRDYLYEDDFPAIEWKMSADTTNIKGIKCQKATGYYRGRQWLVAFAPSIPFSSGPWKLGGLPGLIIEAKDSKNEVAFTLEGFETKKERSGNNYRPSEFKPVDYSLADTIALPAERIKRNNKVKLVKATKAEVDKLRSVMDRDPSASKSIQLNAAGGIIYDEEAFQTLKLRPVIQNPIDKGS